MTVKYKLFIITIIFFINGCSAYSTEHYYAPVINQTGTFKNPSAIFYLKQDWGALKVTIDNISVTTKTFGPWVLAIIPLPPIESRQHENFELTLDLQVEQLPIILDVSKILLILPDGNQVQPITYSTGYAYDSTKSLMKPVRESLEITDKKSEQIKIVYPIDKFKISSLTIKIDGFYVDRTKVEFLPISFHEAKRDVFEWVP